MEAYLEDNRPTLDEICKSYKECCKECPAYEVCKAEFEPQESGDKE